MYKECEERRLAKFNDIKRVKDLVTELEENADYDDEIDMDMEGDKKKKEKTDKNGKKQAYQLNCVPKPSKAKAENLKNYIAKQTIYLKKDHIQKAFMPPSAYPDVDSK